YLDSGPTCSLDGSAVGVRHAEILTDESAVEIDGDQARRRHDSPSQTLSPPKTLTSSMRNAGVNSTAWRRGFRSLLPEPACSTMRHEPPAASSTNSRRRASRRA